MPPSCGKCRRESSLRGSLQISVHGNECATERELAGLRAVETWLVVLAGERLRRTSVEGVLNPDSDLVGIWLALHSRRFRARLEGAGVKPEDVEQSLRDIWKEVTNKGPGGHILTGPIFIEGAEPGDVLEVRIKSIKLAIPYAYNAFSPGRGFLPEDFPYAKMRIIPLDEKLMLAHFADGIEIPLHPFFGSIGVAPPDVSGRISSAPPWIHAGNLDNKELVAGTTLFIPIHARGALFLAGDGHAGQGNGEVDITAMETSLIGTFQLVVRKDMHLKWPRAETPTHYITMGLHEDLNEAT